MALFKSLRGKRENLPSTKTDGYAYFCTDDGSFWIDYKDENGVLQRKQIDSGTVSGHTVNSDVPVDAFIAITTDQIDSICGATIYAASEMTV